MHIIHYLLQTRIISVPAHDKTERVSLSRFPPAPVTNKHGEKLINQKRFRTNGKIRWVHWLTLVLRQANIFGVRPSPLKPRTLC